MTAQRQPDGSMRLRLGPIEYVIFTGLLVGAGMWAWNLSIKIDDTRDRVARIEGAMDARNK